MNSCINILDDYSLLHILSFLSIKEKIYLSSVSTKWNSIINRSFSSLTTINLSKKLWKENLFNLDYTLKPNNQQILKSLLMRCGTYVKEIKINFDSNSYQNILYEMDVLGIGVLCPAIENIEITAPINVLDHELNLMSTCRNIKSLKLTDTSHQYILYPILEIVLSKIFENNQGLAVLELENFYINGTCLSKINPSSIKILHITGIKPLRQNIDFPDFPNIVSFRIKKHSFQIQKVIDSLNQNCRNITQLYLYSLNEALEQNLCELFSNNSQLTALELGSCKINGRCFTYLPNTLETLILIGCNRIASFNLRQCLRNLNNLKNFGLHSSIIMDSDLVNELKACENLENISFTNPAFLLQEELANITQLKNLKSLTLHHFSANISDEFVRTISTELINLTEIIIWNIVITTDSFGYICNLPKLESLDLRALGMTGEGLRPMQNLKTLKCTFCNRLTNEFIIEVVKTSPKLEYLRLEGHKRLRNDLILQINNETKERTNDIILILDFCDTNLIINNNITTDSKYLFVKSSQSMYSRD